MLQALTGVIWCAVAEDTIHTSTQERGSADANSIGVVTWTARPVANDPRNTPANN